MKYHILEKDGKYFVQFKWMLFWFYLLGGNGEISYKAEYKTLEAARDAIAQDKNDRKKKPVKSVVKEVV